MKHGLDCNPRSARETSPLHPLQRGIVAPLSFFEGWPSITLGGCSLGDRLNLKPLWLATNLRDGQSSHFRSCFSRQDELLSLRSRTNKLRYAKTRLEPPTLSQALRHGSCRGWLSSEKSCVGLGSACCRIHILHPVGWPHLREN